MELVGRVDRAGRLAAGPAAPLRAPRRLDHRLVFGRVLVGLEQDPVELLADRRRAGAGDRVRRPRRRSAPRPASCFSMPSSAALTISSGALRKRPLPSAAEVVRRVEQAAAARRPAARRRPWRRSSRAPGRRSRTRPRARIPRRGPGRSRGERLRRASSAAGSGFSNFSSTLAALTLTRLPDSSSTCSELSVSVITRPARNLPASSNRAYMGRDCRLTSAPAPARPPEDAHCLKETPDRSQFPRPPRGVDAKRQVVGAQ